MTTPPRAAALTSRARGQARSLTSTSEATSTRLTSAMNNATGELNLMRVLELLPKRPSLKELAEEFEKDERTIRRYLARLRDDFGVPYVNVKGRYELPPDYEVSEIFVSKKLKIAVATLEALAAGIGYGILGPTIERVRESIPNKAASQVIPFLARFDTIELTKKEQKTFDVLSRAEAETRSVRFKYTDANGRRTKRHVDPWAFIGTGGRLVLTAHDRDKGQMRHFDVSNIEDVKIQPEVYNRPTREMIERLGAYSVSGLYNDKPVDVTVRFDYNTAKAVRQQRPVKAARESAVLLDGGLEAIIPVANLPEFVRWILGCGPGAEVIAPVEARDAVRHAALAIANLHQASRS